MKRILCMIFTLGLILLPSCTSAQTDVQEEKQLSKVELTRTATVFPDLSTVLIQENDLPQGYSAGSVTHKVPTYYLKIFLPDADYFIRQQIQKDAASAGQVDVFYYVSGGTVKFAFDDIKGDMQGAKDLEGVGELAAIEIISKGQNTVQDSVVVVFTQCHVVVHISILGTIDAQTGISYSENLSKRLKPYVCD